MNSGQQTRLPIRQRRKNSRNAARRTWRGRVERLEQRAMLSAAPFGVMTDDTAEVFLGDVLVSLVLMESKPESPLSSNTEDWNAASIQDVKDKVIEGGEWWEQTLDTQFPNNRHTLNFEFDFTYADNPALTDYEPISHTSNWFSFWVPEFLGQVGFNNTNDISKNIREFNHAQREKHGTDWAFTIFIANDENDADNQFAIGGQFRQAFSFPGGEFIVSPASRPPRTFAHEMGHMFWARDEYRGGGSYTDQRGYYNAQNLNAWNNPAPGFVQGVSLMANGVLADTAYAAHMSSPSSLEMVGWRDSDGDGVFDVMDVPHRLEGSGFLDATSGNYRFIGQASVQTLPNLNSSGLQNDITLNRITQIEYRIDEGFWQFVQLADDYVVDLDVSIPMPPSGQHVIEIRAVDQQTGITSNVFRGDTSERASVVDPGISGFVWHDANEDGHFDVQESGLPGWSVQIVDANGQRVDLQRTVDPDDYSAGSPLNNVDTLVTLDTFAGSDSEISADGLVRVIDTSPLTAQHAFGWQGERRIEQPGGSVDIEPIPLTYEWMAGGPQLRMSFAEPVSAIRLDAFGTSPQSGADVDDYGRLEIYDSSGQLLDRITTDPLASGQRETMVLERATADIAFALAKGHVGNAVILDHLVIGPQSETVTDSLGAYALPSLPAGSYLLQAIGPDGEQVSTTQHTVTIAEGEAVEKTNFVGIVSNPSWQNPLLAEDVTSDGYVTALDALNLINWINDRPNDPSLPATPAVPPPYLDVDGNGFITARDVLQVINLINSQAQTQAQAESEPETGTSSGFAEPVPEGETESWRWSISTADGPRSESSSGQAWKVQGIANARHIGSQNAGNRVIGSADHALRDTPNPKDPMGLAEWLSRYEEFSDSPDHDVNADGIADIDRLFAALGRRLN